MQRTATKLTEETRDRKPIYCVQWPKFPKGRERQYFKEKVEAQTFLKQKLAEQANYGIQGMAFNLGQRAEYLECAEKLAPFKATIRDAVNFYLPHLEATNRSCTANQLVDEIIAAKKADGASHRYIKDLRSRLNQFAIAFDGEVVASITTAEIDHWLRGLTNLKGRPVSPTTRNNFRRILNVAFNFARNCGYCIENPVTKSAKAKVVEAAAGILTVDELSRLLKSADDELVPAIAIGAFAGLRRAEIERLDWKEINLQSRLIEVTASKAKSARRRFIKIKPNLFLWLKPYAKASGPVAPPNFRKLLERAQKGAGIENWPNNALRHSFASYYLAHFRKAGAAELALEMGHTSVHLVFHHYRELVKPQEAKRYWNIVPRIAAERSFLLGTQRRQATQFFCGPIINSDSRTNRLHGPRKGQVHCRQ
jgi:integrase